MKGGNSISLVVSICLGLALAIATGFRVFVPLLLLSISSSMHLVDLPKELDWVGSDIALIVLGVATILELLAYLIPGIDNIMDMLQMPIAIIGGMLAMFTVIQDASPVLHWSLTIIVGGGIPAIVKVCMASIRGMFTVFTGGLGNIFLSLLEVGACLFIAFVALFVLI